MYMSNPFETRSLKPDATGQGPLVSAVIPTRNRPELVTRAVRSALGQNYPHMEVLVVIDGPDSATEAVLSAIEDHRLRVVALPENVGGSEARNVGVRSARGEWIAFLDDDDEWLTHKISLQMERAMNSPFRYPIVSSQLFARGLQYEVVWPRSTPYEPLSEYLLARNSWSFGEGLMQSTTLLMPKELLLAVPFRPGLRRHQDIDWVLRAAKHDGTGIEFVLQPLSVWNLGEKRSRVSAGVDWEISLDWIDSLTELITPRAYASFIATQVSPQAATIRDWKAFVVLFRRMIQRGRPRLQDVLLYLGMWFAPRKLRRTLRKANK